jgi:hypothetical protein
MGVSNISPSLKAPSQEKSQTPEGPGDEHLIEGASMLLSLHTRKRRDQYLSESTILENDAISKSPQAKDLLPRRSERNRDASSRNLGCSSALGRERATSPRTHVQQIRNSSPQRKNVTMEQQSEKGIESYKAAGERAFQGKSATDQKSIIMESLKNFKEQIGLHRWKSWIRFCSPEC